MISGRCNISTKYLKASNVRVSFGGVKEEQKYPMCVVLTIF